MRVKISKTSVLDALAEFSLLQTHTNFTHFSFDDKNVPAFIEVEGEVVEEKCNPCCSTTCNKRVCCHTPKSEERCASGPLCSHNTNGRDLDKPCSIEFVAPTPSECCHECIQTSGWLFTNKCENPSCPCHRREYQSHTDKTGFVHNPTKREEKWIKPTAGLACPYYNPDCTKCHNPFRVPNHTKKDCSHGWNREYITEHPKLHAEHPECRLPERVKIEKLPAVREGTTYTANEWMIVGKLNEMIDRLNQI